MYRLSVTENNGATLNLSTDPRYTVFKVEGLNPPQATVNASVSATQDGSVINSTRVELRNLVLYIAINGNIEANRINLYRYFTPKKNVSINFSNDSRDVYIEGVVENVEIDLFSNGQFAQVSIICPRPYFRDVETFVTSFSDVNRLFEFPMNVPPIGVELSTITTNIRKNIIYTGDVEAGVTIQLFATGTVVNPILYDVLKGKSFKLNFTLQESDMVVINTNVGEKSVNLIRNGITTNALGYMTPDSDWFYLTAGDNVFTYECESGSSNLQITYITTLLYGGV